MKKRKQIRKKGTCIDCGTETSGTKYKRCRQCSPAARRSCSYTWKYAYLKKDPKLWKDRSCNSCNKTFAPNHWRSKFCSSHCQQKQNRIETNTYRREQRKDPKYREEFNRLKREAYAALSPAEHNEVRKKRNAYRRKHRDMYNRLCREWYQKHKNDSGHKAKAKIKSAKFYQKNKKKIMERAKQREKTDIQYYLRVRMRTRVNNAIRDYAAGKRKSKGTIELIGCSLSFFKQHIEQQFTKDMSWDKVLGGKIHLDHIKPCCKFDLSKEKEQLKCFNYKNVQPLWAKDNLSKNGF